MTVVSEATKCPQLVQWYEELRAQATGQIPAATPRGLFLFLNSGLPAWMAACPPTALEPAPARAVSGIPARPLDDMAAELVSVLTEMALGGLRRCSP